MRAAVAVLAAWLLAGATLAQATIGEVRWGFDGRVVAGRFNLLSVRVDNTGVEPYAGTLRYWRTHQFQPGRFGAEFVEPCYVAPGSSRWIALYPFIVGMESKWALQVDRDRRVLDAPAVAEPAVVQLAAYPRGIAGSIALFDPARFPPTVLGTEGLGAVVLTEVPDWDAPRREAFLQWVHKGGRVHVLSRGGRHARFSGDLAALDGAEPVTRYGDGVVIREPEGATAAAAARASELRMRPFSHPNKLKYLLSSLRLSVSLRYDWVLIYMCALAYLFAVGPVHWFLAVRKLRAGATLLTLVLLVAGFGYLMHLLGGRGAAEQSIDHSVAYARAIGPDRLELLQFTDVFVTRGDRYRIGAGDPGGTTLLSTAQLYEAVPGVVQAGRDGTMDVDIPLYSHRTIVSATTVAGTPPPVELGDWPDRARDLEFELGADRAEDVKAAVAIFRGEALALRRNGTRLRATGETLDPQLSAAMGGAQLGGAWGTGRQEPLQPRVLLDFAIPDPLPPASDVVHLLMLVPGGSASWLTGTDPGTRYTSVVHHLRFERERPR